MAAVRLQDEDALLALYDRYSSLSYRIILHVLRDESLAEELMQDIFFMIWRRPELYDSQKGTLAAWIAVVSRHRAVDALRRRRNQVSIDDVALSRDGHQERDARTSQTLAQVCGVLATLPVDQRSVFELAYFQGFSHTEISAETGQPLGTVKSRLRSALATLRSIFDQNAA